MLCEITNPLERRLGTTKSAFNACNVRKLSCFTTHFKLAPNDTGLSTKFA